MTIRQFLLKKKTKKRELQCTDKIHRLRFFTHEGKNFQQCLSNSVSFFSFHSKAKFPASCNHQKAEENQKTTEKYRFLRKQKRMWRKTEQKFLWFDCALAFFCLLIMIGDKVNEPQPSPRMVRNKIAWQCFNQLLSSWTFPQTARNVKRRLK